MRTPIFTAGVEPQFSGHETFPLRYAWLKKAYDAVRARSKDDKNRLIFSADEAISEFGVGRNMVGSMRYWALAARIIRDTSTTFKGPYETTELGKAIFDEQKGWDPYIEDPATLWLLHWQLASQQAPTTTIYFAFNHFHSATFYREQLAEELQRVAEQAGVSVAPKTIQRDVEVFVRAYAARVITSEEDSLDSLMAELSLLRPIGRKDGFVFARGPKPTLLNAIFLYGLISYASHRSQGRAFSVESLLHEPGSPGRIFLLDEDALLDRLSSIEEASNERILWSETAGLRQVIFKQDPSAFDLIDVASAAYSRRRSSNAA